MKHKFLPLFFIVSSWFSAQTIDKIVVTGTEFFNVEITTKEGTDFIVSSTGNLEGVLPSDVYGTIEYYDNNFEKYRFGKIKSFGNLTFDYWNTAQENDGRFGKIMKIGALKVDYWTNNSFESHKFGKLKNIGSMEFDFWDKTLSDSGKAGKLKSVNRISVDYFSDFEKGKAGKLKTFGDIKLDYWDDYYGSEEKFGKLKSVSGLSENCNLKAVYVNQIPKGYAPY